MRERGAGWRSLGVYLLLTAASVAILLPFALSTVTAFKSPAEYAATSPLALPQQWTLENFATLLDGPFARALVVTALAAAFLLVTQVPFAVLAAFAFATGRFRGRDALFRVYVATLLFPTPVLVIPLYVILVRASLAGTFWGLVVPFALASPFATFLLRQHFAALPSDLLDAARLDGASEAQVLLRFAVPLCRPAVATVALITVVSQWNAFLWPAVIGGSDWQTVAVATAGLQGRYTGHWTGFDPTRTTRFGYSASNDLNAITLQFLAGNGAAWQRGDAFVLDSARGRSAFQYVVDLIDREHVAPPAAQTNPPNGGSAALDLFLQGRLALFQTGAYNLANVQEGATFDWFVAPLPAGPAGAISVTNGVVASGSARSPHPAAQRAVLRWLGSKAGSLAIGASGAALPAVTAAQEPYFAYWAGKHVDVAPLVDVPRNGTIQAPQGADYAAASDAAQPILNEVFLGRTPVAAGLQQAAAAANAAMRRTG